MGFGHVRCACAYARYVYVCGRNDSIIPDEQLPIDELSRNTVLCHRRFGRMVINWRLLRIFYHPSRCPMALWAQWRQVCVGIGNSFRTDRYSKPIHIVNVLYRYFDQNNKQLPVFDLNFTKFSTTKHNCLCLLANWSGNIWVQYKFRKTIRISHTHATWHCMFRRMDLAVSG